jgi:glycosyltransferase involved in cell wall biosynthesis
MLVTPVAPSPAGNGLAMRAALFAQGLGLSHPLEVIVAPVLDGPGADLRSQLGTAPARERLAALHPRPALAAALAPETAAEVAARAHDCALVHVMRLYLAPALDALLDSGRRPRLSLDLDDLDADLYAAVGEDEEAAAYLRLERYYVPRVDAACVAAPRDRDVLAQRTGAGQIACIPNAVVVPGQAIDEPPEHDLLFVGNLSYWPNADAALWLCHEVLPLLPGVSVAIAGHAPPPAVRALVGHPGVSVIADPPEVASLYARSRLAVVPLRFGGGTPIKALEALAHARAIVATPAGAAGLPDGLVDVAGDPAGFAARCRGLLGSDSRRRERALAGRAHVLAENELDLVAVAIDGWASSILDR